MQQIVYLALVNLPVDGDLMSKTTVPISGVIPYISTTLGMVNRGDGILCKIVVLNPYVTA